MAGYEECAIDDDWDTEEEVFKPCFGRVALRRATSRSLIAEALLQDRSSLIDKTQGSPETTRQHILDEPTIFFDEAILWEWKQRNLWLYNTKESLAVPFFEKARHISFPPCPLSPFILAFFRTSPSTPTN